jgi:hypothetical protein
MNRSVLLVLAAVLLGASPSEVSFAAQSSAGAPASVKSLVAALRRNTAIDLGPYRCTEAEGEPVGSCARVTEYSGLVFDKQRRQVIAFGGGHASTNYNAVNAFSMDTFTWSEKYPPTSCSSMLAKNYDSVRGAWNSGGPGPYPRAAARHTLDLMVMPEDGHELILLTHVEGSALCPGITSTYYDFFSAAKVAHYDLAANRWSFSDAVPDRKFSAAEYDPVSKKILILGTDALAVYDPATKVQFIAVNLNNEYRVQDESGALISKDTLRYNNQLVYFPPNQKMYYFERFEKRVFEITLDRADFRKSQIRRLATKGDHSPHPEPGYAYDSVNRIIGGGVVAGKFYAFDPATRSWTSEQIQGGVPGSQSYHALTYDPTSNVFVFVTDHASGRKTWAYRYAP